MSKLFLGTVGNVEAFKRDELGNLKLVFVSKTLTKSSLSISSTQENIRGGENAAPYFSFNHSPSVEVELTDIVYNRRYIESILGIQFKNETGPVQFMTADGVEFHTVDDKQFYVQYGSNAKSADLYVNSTPDELFLIITAPLFEGDSCSASAGKKVGHITYEIPRFQLDQKLDLAFNMSSNANFTITGEALSMPNSATCEFGGDSLLRIVEVIYGRDVMDDAVALIVDGEVRVGKPPVVYAVLKNRQYVVVQNSRLTFSPELTNGRLGRKNYKISFKDKLSTEIDLSA